MDKERALSQAQMHNNMHNNNPQGYKGNRGFK